MSDLLHQLENNEAILLMYIAGELPEEERREVEQMLASDSSLRALHEELRGAWSAAMSAVEYADGAEPPTLSREVAARQVGRMVRQWHTARLTAPRRIEPARTESRRIPVLLKVSAVAALLGIGVLAWWGFSPEATPTNPASAVADGTAPDATGANPFGPDGPATGHDVVAPQETAEGEEVSHPPEGSVALLSDDPLESTVGDLSGLSSPELGNLERQVRSLRELSP